MAPPPESARDDDLAELEDLEAHVEALESTLAGADEPERGQPERP